MTSVGVTWVDQIEAAALRDALAARKVEHVMLVSSFLAAAALAQAVGNAAGYTHTALLFLEPESATLAVVDSADGPSPMCTDGRCPWLNTAATRCPS